jgi:outer membrane protein TolC
VKNSHVAATFVVLVNTLLGGCAHYESKPLTSQSVEKSLATPDPSALKVAAESLQHPIVNPMAIDLERGVTPEQAAVLALVLNPSLRAERDQRSLSAAQLLQAGLLPNPSLTAGLELPHNNGPADDFTGYNVGLEWEVTSLITHETKVRAARATSASVDLDVAWKEWQTAEAAKTSAYDVIALRAALAAARQADDRQKQNLDLVRRAVEQHSKTLLDLSAAEAAAQDAHAIVLTGQHDLQHQVSALNRSIGLQATSSIELRSDVPLPSQLDPPGIGQLFDGLEERRLDLMALKKGYESEDETLRAAILAQFPKISFGLTRARDTSSVDTIGLGVTMDLPIFDRNQGNIATEKATRQKLFDEYISRVFEARWDISMAIEDIQATNAQIADAEAALPQLQRFADVYRDALQKGNVDVLSYYAAQTSLINKQLAIVKLKQQLIENWIALEIAAGQYLPIPASAATQPTTREAGE